MVPDLKAKDGEPCLGLWEGVERVISIHATAPRSVQWQALFHEQVHQVLWDSGLRVGEAVEEQVCDLIGTARVAELLASTQQKPRV
jgi:hypothetical protein